jgi:hypothetical protein
MPLPTLTDLSHARLAGRTPDSGITHPANRSLLRLFGHAAAKAPPFGADWDPVRLFGRASGDGIGSDADIGRYRIEYLYRAGHEYFYDPLWAVTSAIYAHSRYAKNINQQEIFLE